MIKLTTHKITDTEKRMFLGRGNKVYMDDGKYTIDTFDGERIHIEDEEGDLLSVKTEILDILPKIEEFKTFVKDVILIKKYEKEGTVNENLTSEERKVLEQYIDCYADLKEPELFFNGNQYLAINPVTLSHAEYDPDTGLYMVVNLNDYFETKSLELAFKPSFEFQYPEL